MNKKSFDHFLSFWQQLTQSRPVRKRVRGNHRVARAKARLRLAMSVR